MNNKSDIAKALSGASMTNAEWEELYSKVDWDKLFKREGRK